MNGIARRTTHANQTTIDITSTHAKASIIGAVLINVSTFLQRITRSAEQYTQPRRWSLILSAAFRFFLKGKILGDNFRIAQATG